MKQKKRCFSELKETMTTRELESFCRRIATQYAKSELHFSSSYFVKAENISKNCFYKVLDEAVVKNLVSDDLVYKMEKKAILNQKSHVAEAGKTTDRHYAILRKKRNEYILQLYSDEEIKTIAVDFAESKEKTKYDFAKKYGISISILDNILRKAFIQNIADDKTCRMIEERSLEKDSSIRAKIFFKNLWEIRKNR